MNAPLDKISILRARDGDLCWLCSEKMDFSAKPNSGRAWSIEHLLAKSFDGPDCLENLVLFHPRCNRILGNRPLKEKVKLRERRRRKLWFSTLASKSRQGC